MGSNSNRLACTFLSLRFAAAIVFSNRLCNHSGSRFVIIIKQIGKLRASCILALYISSCIQHSFCIRNQPFLLRPTQSPKNHKHSFLLLRKLRVKGISIRAIIKDMFKKAFGGKKNNKNVETSLIEQYWYPKFGPGQLWESVADDVKKLGGTVKMNCRVKNIEVKDGKILSVLCDTASGEEKTEGDIFISSMPVKDLVSGIVGDEPSEEIANIAKGLPYRDFVTVGLLLSRLDLKNETSIKTLGNIVPDCWIYVQEPDVKLGRIQVFNNWSPYMVKDPEKTVWIGLEYFCTEGDDFWNMSDEECTDFAVGELEKMGVINRADVLDSHRERVKKAYPAYFDTYDQMDKAIEYLNSIDNLYCIGRNGQHRYNNMDHSMATAMRAVDCITGRESDKNVIWNVNTEQEYHEEKKAE